MFLAVVMVGDGGGDGPESWVQNARLAAAKDLLYQLENQPLIERIVLLSPSFEGFERFTEIVHVQSQPGQIYVGKHLAMLVDRFQARRLLYFGGGAAPLLENPAMTELVSQIANSEQGVFTNNRYASDWAGVVPATVLAEWQSRVPQDNMLGWVLSAEAGLPVHTLNASAASRLDIDTPTDLVALKMHPGTHRHLSEFLKTLPLDTARFEQVLEVLNTPAAHVLLAGRIGPEAWTALNRVTQCWVRVFSEERGMRSSGRQSRAEVFSLLADYIEAIGFRSFFRKLANQVQAALIDTRVLLAHEGRWPSRSNRFASDLGLVEQVHDPWLRRLTEEAVASPIPIIFGGHGLLSGDLFALCDLL
jgi:hypothetical protein